jgi:hypothetical protein
MLSPQVLPLSHIGDMVHCQYRQLLPDLPFSGPTLTIRGTLAEDRPQVMPSPFHDSAGRSSYAETDLARSQSDLHHWMSALEWCLSQEPS